MFYLETDIIQRLSVKTRCLKIFHPFGFFKENVVIFFSNFKCSFLSKKHPTRELGKLDGGGIGVSENSLAVVKLHAIYNTI